MDNQETEKNPQDKAWSIADVMARFTTQEAKLSQVKDGKYQDSVGNEITNKMLMEYPCKIDGDDGMLWL